MRKTPHAQLSWLFANFLHENRQEASTQKFTNPCESSHRFTYIMIDHVSGLCNCSNMRGAELIDTLFNPGQLKQLLICRLRFKLFT